MALLEILHFPDPKLRIQAKTVTKVDSNIRRIINDLFETMYDAPGIGLAATQVNIHQRIIVIDVTENHNQPLCFVNPKLIAYTGNTCSEEGCLSVPGVFEPVERYAQITVQAQDHSGKEFELTAEGLLAICIQHEIDHLQGKLFVDHLSSLKRQRLQKKFQKPLNKAIK